MEYTESEVKELLEYQRKLCWEALFNRNEWVDSEEDAILNAPEPKLK